MPEVPIVMPQLGESIAEATVIRFSVSVGDLIEVDQEIIEVETSKATMCVPTLCSGVVKSIIAKEGVSYAVGSLLGIIEVSDEEIERTGVTTMESIQDEAESERGDEANLHFKIDGEDYYEPKTVEPSIQGLPVPVGTKGAHYISPRMRARMNELGLRDADIAAINGSGAGGRVTIDDFERFLDYIETWPSISASSMRLAVADAMRRSWSRPLATVGRPLIMDKLLAYRSEQNPKPGLTLYILRALALALAENPSVAGYLLGNRIVHPRAFDIGVAVQVESGVVVPVVRDVDTKSVAELTQEYSELVELSRAKKLTMEHTKGGIATVTNFGTFGLTWATPIPLPNETLILGLSAGVKRPTWSEEVQAFVPYTEAELNLTFDHRVIDGGDAGSLLIRVAELLNKPEEL